MMVLLFDGKVSVLPPLPAPSHPDSLVNMAAFIIILILIYFLLEIYSAMLLSGVQQK